jgi:hypothetical protein
VTSVPTCNRELRSGSVCFHQPTVANTAAK